MKRIMMTVLLSVLTAAALPVGIANALSTAWTAGTTSNWDTDGSWNNSEPGFSDFAFINNGETAQVTYSGEEANCPYLGYDIGESGHVSMLSGSLTIGSYEYIGRSGTGTFSQSGGTHTVGSNLNLGYLSGSNGT